MRQAHGTLSGYVNGKCRCPECKAAETAYRAKRAQVVQLDDLLTQCWCAHGYVWVPPADIRAGRTKSCGHPRCTQETAA